MSTVGLGDITPSNTYETGVYILFIVISSGTFSYFFNAIGIIIEDMNKKKKNFSEEMRLLSRYFFNKNLSDELKIEIKRHLEYKFELENELSLEEVKNVFNKLPTSI
jgi:hypothetical protein